LTAQFELAVDPERYVWQLSAGEQQRVEILRLLLRGADILLLDEPTALLTPLETRGLFRSIRALAAQGKAVVLVSHNLDEAIEVSDYITILRDGRVVGAMPATQAEPGDLARRMVGRPVDRPFRPAGVIAPGASLLQIRGLEVLGDQGQAAIQG